MKKEQFNFWHSVKMQRVIQDGGGYDLNTCLIDGKVLNYTLCTTTEAHGCGWDDIRYLGVGTIAALGQSAIAKTNEGARRYR